MVKQFVAGIVAVVMLAGVSAAGPYEDGLAAYERGDYSTGLELLRPLAEQGDAPAQYALGGMYKDGEGVPQDFAEAVKWYRLAAEQGLPLAQTLLGGMYFTGEGVPQDYAEAVKWFRLGADQGAAKSMLGLGLMYGNGVGVPQDIVLSHMWLNLASVGFEGAKKTREIVASQMTPDQIAEAQRLAREWIDAHPTVELGIW